MARLDRRKIEEKVFRVLMVASILVVLSSLFSVFAVVVVRGASALSLGMLTQTPKGGYYLGKEGGILNAIVGSLYLATGATVVSMVIGLPVALYIHEYMGESRRASQVRRLLDVLCGVPSIVFGAFAFTVMIYFRARASLFWGIITVSLFEFPMMARSVDEVLKTVPQSLRETAYALGSTRFEVVSRVVTRQALPGILTAVLIGFGRAIGDAAAVMLTTGYTDNIPGSLFDPAATLPLAVFFQLATPIVEVQRRAYASGIVLLAIVLGLSVFSRWSSKRLMRQVVR
ncbi:phosphate ABC transporter permease PstA [Candidatus Bathyarchaeota archaeon]|nr:phosphate ABC transporter permease PstA [Candidatus Bathyarchaeota archaeon]